MGEKNRHLRSVSCCYIFYHLQPNLISADKWTLLTTHVLKTASPLSFSSQTAFELSPCASFTSSLLSCLNLVQRGFHCHPVETALVRCTDLRLPLLILPNRAVALGILHFLTSLSFLEVCVITLSRVFLDPSGYYYSVSFAILPFNCLLLHSPVVSQAFEPNVSKMRLLILSPPKPGSTSIILILANSPSWFI